MMKIKQHPGTGLWVTDDGRVIIPPDGHRFLKFRFTYGSRYNTGYMVVRYRGKRYLVHKLIIEAFIENKLGLPTTDHINRIRDDNRLENLRYASYKLQADNTQKVDDSLAKYGVRSCEDRNKYQRAFYAGNPEYAERERAGNREWRAKNAELKRAKNLEYGAKQRALGRRYRKCPDGTHHWLTDEEFNKRYKELLHG
jgi:hypothetical protein